MVLNMIETQLIPFELHEICLDENNNHFSAFEDMFKILFL